MGRQPINPWKWQDRFNFTQCWRVDGPNSLIFVSGQSNISAEGEVLHSDDFEAQVRLTFQNLQTVLRQAGASLEHVVKLGAYLTNMQNLPAYSAVQTEFFGSHPPAQTIVQVAALALPGMDVEVEAMAVLVE